MPRKKHNDIEMPIPLKMVQDFKKKFPEAWNTCDTAINAFRKEPEAFDFTWDESRCIFPSIFGMAVMDTLCKKYNKPYNHEGAAELTALYAWRKYKEIYAFDGDFAELLMKDADCNLTIPVMTLLRTPYPTFYVQLDGDTSLGVKGFFCNFDYVRTNDDKAMELALNFLAIADDFTFGIPLYIKDDFTIEDSIQELRNILTDSGLMSAEYELSLETGSDFISKAIQLVLYICAANAEISENPIQKSITRKSTTNHQPKDALREVRKWDVGYRIGTVIRMTQSDDTTPTEHHIGKSHKSSSKRPHIRRGHFHRYWIGSESDNSKALILKWVAPMFINAVENDDMPAVVTKVE